MANRSKWLDAVVPMVPGLPTGQRGRWLIERKTVTKEKEEWHRLRAMVNGHGRYVPAGDYTGLIMLGKDGKRSPFASPMMSDTPDERRDHYWPVKKARGVCLITGLGLGVVANAMLLKPEVERVVVIEIEQDVIELVEPHWRGVHGDRLQVIHASAFTWKPPKGQRYGVVWHDIWPTISEDNLREMAMLKRRFARRADWQGAWAQDECRALRAGRRF